MRQGPHIKRKKTYFLERAVIEKKGVEKTGNGLQRRILRFHRGCGGIWWFFHGLLGKGDFHSKVFLFHRNRGEWGLPFGVDIGLDLFHHFSEGGVLFHLLFDLLNGVEDRGVIPVVKDLADLIQTEIRHGTD